MSLSLEEFQKLDRQLKVAGYQADLRYYAEPTYKFACYRGKGLRIRIVNHSDVFSIDIAHDKNFDRWANSHEFEITVKPTYLILTLQYARELIRRRGWRDGKIWDTVNLDTMASDGVRSIRFSHPGSRDIAFYSFLNERMKT